jgi:hypothetical protein
MEKSHRSQRCRHLCPGDLPVFGQADAMSFPLESCIFIMPSPFTASSGLLKVNIALLGYVGIWKGSYY